MTLIYNVSNVFDKYLDINCVMSICYACKYVDIVHFYVVVV